MEPKCANAAHALPHDNPKPIRERTETLGRPMRIPSARSAGGVCRTLFLSVEQARRV